MSLRRALEVGLKLCIFCGKSNKPKDNVREGTSYSKNVSSFNFFSGMAPFTHSTRVKRKSNLPDLSSAADQLLKTSCDAMNCVQPLEKSPSERLSLLIPTKFNNATCDVLYDVTCCSECILQRNKNI